MTTPAVNRSVSVRKATTARRVDGTTQTYLQTITASRRTRPASVKSPVRSDGTRAPRGWQGTWSQCWSSEGFIDYQYSGGSHASVSGCVVRELPYDIPNPSSFSAYVAATRQKALSQSTSKDMQFNAAMAQASSTGRMIGKASTNLAHGINNLMQGPKGLARTAGKFSQWRKAPSAYLEYLYGWRPLAEDVSNAFDKLNDYKNRNMGYEMRVQAANIDRIPLYRTLAAITPGNGGTSNKAVWRGTREVITRAGYIFRLPDWFVQNTPIISPYSTAWELTPWSFVADWVLPIGNWIGSMESAQFAPHFKEGFETIMIQDRWSVSEFDTSVTSSPWITSGRSNARCLNGALARAAVTSYPWNHLPPPTLAKLPGLQQGAQGLALLTQVLQRWR